jgi:WD40 repeat protein
VSINPIDDTTLVVGNRGTVIAIDPNNVVTKINSSTCENLRVVRWNQNGTEALIVGNNGTLIKYAARGSEAVDACRANLRGISWRKNTPLALVTSNCFAEEFMPSPNLFLFNANQNMLNPVSEGRSDLIGVDWNPDGSFAVVVGYDVVWHNGVIGRFDDSGLSPIDFENSHVYPTAVSWDPTGVAAIATAFPEPRSSQGKIMLWDGQVLREIYRSEDSFFSNVAWSPAGFKLAAVASTETRTFDS